MRKASEPWIFMSHSNLDAVLARRLRKALEQRGAHPVLLYPKVAGSNKKIRELVFEEIAANIFVLCDSPHAREPIWAQKKVSCVQSLPHKRFADVGITADWDRQIARIEQLLAEGTVFVSSTITDAERVRPFVQQLTTSDLEVW